MFGLTIRNLDLMHQGDDAEPFLTVRNVRFRRGEWTYRQGRVGQRQDLADQGDQRALAAMAAATSSSPRA